MELNFSVAKNVLESMGWLFGDGWGHNRHFFMHSLKSHPIFTLAFTPQLPTPCLPPLLSNRDGL